MKEIVLHIDTSSNKTVIVGLTINSKKYSISRELDKRKAQIVLPMIDEIFKKYNLKSENLTSIVVNVGPGSFTGIRVGVSIANTLATYHMIPINNMPLGQLAEPVYS